MKKGGADKAESNGIPDGGKRRKFVPLIQDGADVF